MHGHQRLLDVSVMCVSQVMHGSGSDVLWLQRDFHVYLVNVFDTAVACQVQSA